MSNWYEMAPPNGNPLDVPDGTAFFAPGAMNETVVVRIDTAIDKVDFTAGNDQYVIYILGPGTLAIRGAGIANASGLEQRFTVDGAAARLYFLNSSVAGIGAPANRIAITNKNGGETHFRGTSNASNAKITNERNSRLYFYNDSSAGSAELINEQSGSQIHFRDQATGDTAQINNESGKVYVSQSQRKSVPIGKIDNKSKLIIGKTKVEVADTLTLSKKSTVSMNFNKKSGGKILVANTAKLKGTLIVAGSTKMKTGRYLLIKSQTNRKGQFNKTTLKRFGKNRQASIVYQGKKVYLVVRNK